MRVPAFTSSVVALCLGMAAVSAAQPPLAGVAASLRPTFHADIGPLVAEKCGSCHRPGGGAPFSMTTYVDVRQRATLIAQVTRTRTMPPWKARGPAGVFADDRRLTDEQIALIQRWIDEGAPEGEPSAELDAGRPATEWELGVPDLVVSMPQAYLVPGDGADTIRTFVIPIPSTRDRFVRGIEFHPETAGVVHHANIKIDVTGSTRRIDGHDPVPGFDGSGPNAQFPDGQFLGWTPGQRPHVSDDTAWRLPAGADLVLELHMTPSGKAERVQCRIGFLFTDVPPTRTPYMLRLSNQRLDIPAGASRHVSTDRYLLPVDVDVLALQPHAHNLARAVTGTARLPDGRIERLIEIVDWDFRWQDVYRFVRPVRLPRGTSLEMEYVYDNSDGNPRNPFRPPRRVTFGQTTDAEMGDLWMQVMTSTPAERAALHDDFAPKMLRDDTDGDEMLVVSRPRDPRIRRDLAYYYVAAGRVADAIAQLERSLELDPESAAGQFELGTVLLNEKRLSEAIPRLERATTLQPDWSDAYNNLGAVYLLRGEMDAARQAFDRAIVLDPRSSQAQFNRGRLLMAQRRQPEALAAFMESLRLKPDDPDTLAAAAAAQVSTGDVPGAIRGYREALRIRPDHLSALTDLAWILASGQPADAARADEAVRIAERADALTSSENVVVLDTLAASYFAAGRIADAITTADRAVALAVARGDATAARDIGERLIAYRASRR